MLGLLIRDKPNLEHFCGAPFVLSSCGHCYSPGAYPKIYILRNYAVHKRASVLLCKRSRQSKQSITF